MSPAGQQLGYKTIFLGRDKSTNPYAVFQQWDTQRCFDAVSKTLEGSATYKNCSVRFTQDAVSKLWFLTIPQDLPDGMYLVIIREAAAGSEANTDLAVSIILINWSHAAGYLKVGQNDIFISY